MSSSSSSRMVHAGGVFPAGGPAVLPGVAPGRAAAPGAPAPPTEPFFPASAAFSPGFGLFSLSAGGLAKAVESTASSNMFAGVSWWAAFNFSRVTMDTSMSVVNDVEQIKRARYMSGKDVNDLVTTKQHVLSLYGPRPPVAVLGGQDGAQGTKGTIGASASAGYAWHVYQRKLLVWRFQPNEDTKSSPSIAVELLLPKSDLPHHASLVKVFRSRQSSTAVSCLAVSPEGVIRYWDVVSPHASWTDVDGGLGGEEVTYAAHVAPYGVLAVTTSASIILIRPPETSSSSITVRLLSGTQGWLGGLGHRVSTIIFGGSSSANVSSHDVDGLESGNKAVKMITVPGLRNGKVEWQVFLFLGLKLQMRIVRDNQSANLEFEVDLEPIFRKHFLARSKSSDLELAVLDVKVSEGGLAVLAASSEPRRYLLFDLPIDGSFPPDHAYVLCDLNPRDVDILERNSGRIANLQFQLLPTTALIYNQRTIVGVPMDGGSGGRGDVLTVPGDGALLGGLVHHGSPTFFNPTYGFIVVQPVDVACFDILTSRRSSVMKSSKSTAKSPSHMTEAVKTAFLMYVRQNVTHSRGILAKEFPINRQSQVDSPLSLTLLK
ncbi:unnamed protein product [Nesidiocoris tenuis]|uniref:Nucleoporin Nup133/Nup155-like N-terminal domain-containing protein n=1 Tax=Nesidiocoris tenuis TaxID=355587 RepID=A0A6H5HJG6_9HEMI|nr:unnamed protein product [Nesidiocoris tenuis]